MNAPSSLVQFNARLKTPRELVLSYAPKDTNMGQVIEAIQAAGLGIIDIRSQDRKLEDVFLELTR